MHKIIDHGADLPTDCLLDLIESFSVPALILIKERYADISVHRQKLPVSLPFKAFCIKLQTASSWKCWAAIAFKEMSNLKMRHYCILYFARPAALHGKGIRKSYVKLTG